MKQAPDIAGETSFISRAAIAAETVSLAMDWRQADHGGI